ncbi:MAG TPA: GNAT family N-acetyltransferase [Bryobacteraceae bacterium]|nr:GNAT family N-acetyltransferase [Bryobacteraceae bacterium]
MRVVIETERLLLREMSPDDLDIIAPMLADPDVMRFWPRPYTREETVRWIERWVHDYAEYGCGYWLMLEKAGLRPAGQAGLVMLTIDGVHAPSLGYIVDKRFWNRGYATEAASACLEWALARWPVVITPIRPENAPSLRVAEKLGLKEERRTMYAGFEHALFYARG